MVLTGTAARDLVGRSGTGLLLDLDGTLVDSEPVHRAAFADYFAGRGWEVPDGVIRQFAGRRAQEVFPVLDGPWRGEDPDELTAGVVAALRRGRRRPVPVAGAVELLRGCSVTGLPVAVVTSALREWTDGVLRLLGARGPAVVAAEDCTHGKPDPEPYVRGAAALRLEPWSLIAAEDTPAGIASARAAGVGTVVGMTTSHPAEVLLAAGADEVADDLEVLAQAVLGR